MACGKNFKSYLVGGFSATGGFLFGYQTGIISGVLIMDDFKTKMGIDDNNNSTAPPLSTFDTINGSIVGVLLLGCVLGSLIAGQTSDRFSRKYSIAAFSIIFTIGAAVQTASNGLIMLLVGRFFAGISIGALSMIIPVYHSEIATTKVRGRIITLQQLAVTIGIATSFWINFAINKSTFKGTPWEWRIPFGVQMIPSLILAIGIFFCPFSPRWLISHNHEDEARDVFMMIRSASHDEMEEEMDRIRDELASLRENEIKSYRQLFRFPLLRPFLLGIGIHVFQQLTGINSIMYYAPRIFIQLPANDPDGDEYIRTFSIFLTAIDGCVNILFTIPTLIFIDRLGRRILLITGAIIMSISMLFVGILAAITEDRICDFYEEECPSTFWAKIIFIYIFVAGFAFSWGPIPWIYPTEIFPLTMRAKGTSLTTAANWATNCAISFLVPTLLDRMHFGIFIIFSVLSAIMTGIVYLFYPETKRKPLEQNSLIDSSRLFVPRWLERRRKKYNTSTAQEMVNHAQVPFTNKQNIVDRSNQINTSDSTIQRDDHIHEKNVDPDETVD